MDPAPSARGPARAVHVRVGNPRGAHAEQGERRDDGALPASHEMERLIAQLPPPLQALLTPLNLALLAVLALIVHRSLPSLPTGPLPSKPTAYNWRPATYPKTLVWASYTEAELRRFDGTYSPAPDSQPDERMLAQDGKPRILFAIRRKVYDVSSGRSFYGPGSFALV